MLINTDDFFLQLTYFMVAKRFFKISSRLLKEHIFGSIISLKFSLMYKTVLNSIKTLKRYCKANLNMFFKLKKILMMTKKKLSFDRLFV